MLLFERTKKYASGILNERYPEGISPLLASLLYARGAKTEAEMHAFLHPSLDDLCDPFLLNDMDRAKARIEKAIAEGEHICIYGDYDVDGMCAAALLMLSLEENGADVSYFIPTRKSDGYGMSEHTVKAVAQRGTRLIITVDNGIKSNEEIALCYRLGMDVIVTDHHVCGEDIPECEAVVCHTLPTSVYPNGDICGAGTALKLVHALFGFDAMKKYIPLAGIATVADVVPLLGENRVLVAFALKMLAEGNCPIGVKTLLESAVGVKDEYVTSDISFGFAPRLNAAGRMESAVMGVELLCSKSEEEALGISKKLNELNARRQDEESAICREVVAKVEEMDLSDTYCVMLKSDNWHQGVVGIASSRIAERYYRPAMLFSEHDGVLTGSARSVPNVDIYNALLKVQNRFLKFGGHAYAAGITLDKDTDFEAVHNEINAAFAELNEKDLFIPRKFYEAEIDVDDITEALVKEINMLAPFGTGNSAPVFLSRSLSASKVRRVGKDGVHLSLFLHGNKSSFKSIAFSMGDRFDEVMDSSRLDILYSPSLDAFGGKANIQLKISALCKAEITDMSEAEAYFENHTEDFKRSLLENVCAVSEKNSFGSLDTDGVFKLIGDSAWGTAVLCFTKSGAMDFQKELLRRGLIKRCDTAFLCNRAAPCPYNVAVYAPVADRLSLSRFKNIVIYDEVPFEGIAQKIAQAAENGNVFMHSHEQEEHRKSTVMTARRIFGGRDGIIPYYRAMKEAGPEFYNEKELVLKLMNRVEDADGVSCDFALRVCMELGFACETAGGGIRVVEAPEKKELEESFIYASIKKLAEQI